MRTLPLLLIAPPLNPTFLSKEESRTDKVAFSLKIAPPPIPSSVVFILNLDFLMFATAFLMKTAPPYIFARLSVNVESDRDTSPLLTYMPPPSIVEFLLKTQLCSVNVPFILLTVPYSLALFSMKSHPSIIFISPLLNNAPPETLDSFLINLQLIRENEVSWAA